ncbi:hypothetical protein FRB90_000010 [Tulasnella sp. 427]|nr:hypothetical protein FRB90_000010 [Tulasnella sp. 427]
MPPKSKARSSKRAQVASSDGEDEQMQVARPSGSKSRSVVPTGRKSTRRAAEDEDEDMDDEVEEGESQALVAQQDDDVDLFDPANFGDQPLDSAYAERKIQTFMNDWSTLEGKITEMIPVLENAAVSVEEHQEEDKGTVAKMDESMRHLLDLRQELHGYQSVLERLKREAARNDDITDIVERYEKGMKAELNEYRNKTSRQKYSKVKEYAQFKEVIWEVNHANEAMPPIRSQIDREEGDSDSDGSDIEVGGVTQNFTCSLSLMPFVDPMTSKICGHSFSREPLEDYFKQQGKRGGAVAKCPASGCNKKLSLADFAINKDLAKRTNAAERRKRRRALDDQDEEDSMDVL